MTIAIHRINMQETISGSRDLSKRCFAVFLSYFHIFCCMLLVRSGFAQVSGSNPETLFCSQCVLSLSCPRLRLLGNDAATANPQGCHLDASFVG